MIEKIYLSKLRGEAHYQFMGSFIALTSKYPVIVNKISTPFQNLQTLYATETEIIDQMRKSDYTAKIVAADHRLDNAVQGFGQNVHTAVHHFDPAIADAAYSLKNLFKSFGKIERKSYREESAAVSTLLKELSGAYAEKAALISGLNGWIVEMNAANAEVVALLADRAAEKASRPPERLKNVRSDIDAVYHDIIARIEAFILLEGETEYLVFVRDLNALIEDLHKIRPHHRKNPDTKEA